MYIVGLKAAISSMELVTLSYRDQEGRNFLSRIWGNLAFVSGGDFRRKDLGLRVGGRSSSISGDNLSEIVVARRNPEDSIKFCLRGRNNKAGRACLVYVQHMPGESG